MVEAMRGHFDRIYSIELSEALCWNAQKRFKDYNNIEIICGDSITELEKVIQHLDQPSLFWLDGHYSAGVTAKGVKNTPVMKN